MVRFQNISKTYPPDTIALSNISFEVQPEEFVSIVGKSGMDLPLASKAKL